MSGIKRAANRPKIAKHLRSPQQKTHLNRTKEERDRDHATSDVWAERERAKPENQRAVEGPRRFKGTSD